MATAVPSRFAVLSIDEDDHKPKRTQKPTSAGKTSSKSSNKNDKQKQQFTKKDDKKKQPSKNKKKKGNNDSQQWEQWKEKDSMAIEETYEQELHQAILLSKLAYEAQGENGTASKDSDASKKSQGNKKSKKATMSLDEFNNMNTPTIITSEASVVLVPESVDCKTRESDAEFFERVDKETKEEITKGKEKDMLKTRLNQLDDDITSAQLKVEVEKRDQQIGQLRDEVEALKDELTEVKKRNRKLYQILSHGEMKDKASVLAEVTKLQEIREELTLEVTTLHAQLEQERSKSRVASADVKTAKQNNKKRPASENA